jgi:hypothetical protein
MKFDGLKDLGGKKPSLKQTVAMFLDGRYQLFVSFKKPISIPVI